MVETLSGMLPPPIFTQPPPPIPASQQPSWMMSPHLRGSIRPATSEPHLPGFGNHQMSSSPFCRHPRSALQTHVPPPNFATGQHHCSPPQPPSFYDDGSCLSVAKQLSQSRLGAFASSAEAQGAGAASTMGSGVSAGGAVAPISNPATQFKTEGPTAGGQTGGRTHSPLARQFPISSAYEPFIRSLSPHSVHHSPPHHDHLRVSGGSRRGRSVSPDVQSRLGALQQHPQHLVGASMLPGGGGNYEQQFPPPNVVRDRMQSDSTAGGMETGHPPHVGPMANQALNRLTRQNSCSDTQLNVTTGELQETEVQIS